MKPNSGGSVAVKKHLKPKLGLLVPSKQVGVQLYNVFAKALRGEVQLEFFYEAFGENGLTSMIEPKSKTKSEAKYEMPLPKVEQPVPIAEVKCEYPNNIKKRNGEEVGEL